MNNIELIDDLCKITTLQSDIIRKQAYIIEQHRIVGSFKSERNDVNDLLDTVEFKLRKN